MKISGITKIEVANADIISRANIVLNSNGTIKNFAADFSDLQIIPDSATCEVASKLNVSTPIHTLSLAFSTHLDSNSLPPHPIFRITDVNDTIYIYGLPVPPFASLKVEVETGKPGASTATRFSYSLKVPYNLFILNHSFL